MTNLRRSKSQQEDGTPVYASAPRVGDEEIIATHNFADECCWFGDSTRVTDETLTVDSSDPSGKTFESTHAHWIDMFSGRLMNQDRWVDEEPVGHGYQIVVKVDGVEQTQRPFPDASGTYDCEVICHLGKVVFLGSAPTGTVTASYSYATTNTFYLTPDSGYVLRIEKGEADFSVGNANGKWRIVFTDEIQYEIWGYAWYYAPQYPSVRAHASGNVTLSGTQTVDSVTLKDGDQVACMNQTDSTEDGMWIVNASGSWVRSPYFPVGAHVAGYLYFPTEGTTYGRTGQIIANTPPDDVVGTDDLIPYQYFSKNERVDLQLDRYQRSTQIIQEARGAHPVIKAVGATDQQLSDLDSSNDIEEFRRVSRGMASDLQPIPFPYDTIRALESCKGHQLRVKTAYGDSVMGGETVTLTFYCTKTPETA